MRRIANLNGLPVWEFEIGDEVIARSREEQERLTGDYYSLGSGKIIITSGKINNKQPSRGNFVNADIANIAGMFSCRFLPVRIPHSSREIIE